jgi:hypothetical protein
MIMALMCLSLAACRSEISQPSDTNPVSEPPAIERPAETPTPSAPPAAAETTPPAQPSDSAMTETDASDAPVEREEAGVGVGIKGRSLDAPDVNKMIAEPARQYFRIRERVVFEVQIPHAMQLYQATEGQAPKSHDEFMQKIIQANSIKLPELPPGGRYIYDPGTEQLMVERPAK